MNGPDGRRDRPSSVGPPACVPDEDGSCSICGDEGWIGEVVGFSTEGRTGVVRSEESGEAAAEREVALDLLPDAEPGDRVVVHMGFAIARVRDAGPAGR